jgi:integrase
MIQPLFASNLVGKLLPAKAHRTFLAFHMRRDLRGLFSLTASPDQAREQEISAKIRKYIVLRPEALIATALWVIDFSPAEGISSPYRDVSRDRVLTDQELAAVILAARRMPPPYGRIVEFLALTGQRREEAAQLTWEEIDELSRLICSHGTGLQSLPPQHSGAYQPCTNNSNRAILNTVD